MASNQLSKDTFLGINWFLYALCVVFLFARLYIRWACFRRLFVEDYFIVAAMALLTGVEAMSQRFADSIYFLMAWVNGTVTPPNLLQFLANTEAMLRACGSAIILFLVGFYFVKINFLLFFYRMGYRLLLIYRILWWFVFVVVLSCGVISVAIGVTTFKCLFDGVIYTFTTCETPAYENIYFTYFRVTVALDIFTDALIIGFPVWLLWGIRITIRRKLALGGIFSLVGFTIVATVLRGALLTEVFAETKDGKTFNIPWVWFWFHIEFCIAFIVSCLVSFRALFAHNERQSITRGRQQSPGRYPPYPSSGGGGSTTVVGSGNGSRGNLIPFFRKSRLKGFQDSILDTCRTLEGLGDEGSSLVEVDLVAGPHHRRQPQADVVAEQGHIGGLRDINAAGGGGQGLDYSARDLQHHERDVERDSQGVSILDADDAPDADDGPQGQDTMLTSQLSLDSLYMSRSSHSGSRPGTK